MIITKSISLDHKDLDKIEELIENGKYNSFSHFVRVGISKMLNTE